MTKKYFSIMYYVSLIHRSGGMYFDRNLSSLNIRAAQVPILLMLNLRDGINQETISNYFNTDKSTTTKTIKPLIKEKYVYRKINPDDKRAFQIYLSSKGKKIIPFIKDLLDSWVDILTEDYTDKEKKIILDLLLKMSDNAKNYIKNS